MLDKEHIDKVINLTSQNTYCNSLYRKTKSVECVTPNRFPKWTEEIDSPDAILFEESDSMEQRTVKLESIGCHVEGVAQNRTLVAHLSKSEIERVKRLNEIRAEDDKVKYRVVPWDKTNCIKNVFIVPKDYDPFRQYDRFDLTYEDIHTISEQERLALYEYAKRGREVVSMLPRIERNVNVPENSVNLFLGGFHLINEHKEISTLIKLKDLNPDSNTFTYSFLGGVPIDSFEGIKSGQEKGHTFHMHLLDEDGVVQHAVAYSQHSNVTENKITFSKAKSDELRELMSFDADGNSHLYVAFRNIYKDGSNYDNISVTKFGDVVIQNVKIDTISDYGLRASANKDIYLDKVEFGSLKSASKPFSVDTGIHVSKARGKIDITNSIFSKSFDDHVNYYGGKGVLAMYEPINEAGTKFRACVITNNKPKIGSVYQAVAPENGRLDYLFSVSRLINEEPGCNRLGAEADYPQSKDGWGKEELYEPYWVILEIKNLRDVRSPNTDDTLLRKRYVSGEYSKDSQMLFVADSSGKNSSINYDSEEMFEYLSEGGVDARNAESQHYVLFDISPEIGYGVIRNNIFISAGKNGVVGKSHNMQIIDNVFINSRKGDLGLNSYSRGRTIEGPYQFNTIVSNNIFVNEKLDHSVNFDFVPPIEIISQGWSNSLTVQNQKHWDSNIRVHSSNECYSRNNNNMIFHKNTKYINDVKNCRPLTW